MIKTLDTTELVSYTAVDTILEMVRIKQDISAFVNTTPLDTKIEEVEKNGWS